VSQVRLISLETLYAVIGAVFALTAARIASDAAHPRRWGSTGFWALLAIVFIFGKALPPALVGYLVLAMAGLAATGQVAAAANGGATREERAAEAARLGNRLFLPALLIPAAAVAGTLLLGRIHAGRIWLVDPRQVTLISLALGALIALLAALRTTGAGLAAPAQEAGRLLQAIGWALILPQMLAALGGVFARAEVGAAVADIVARALPTQYAFVAVAAYCLGMALFTICMGNAFAAFAVITLGVGLPLVVQRHGGNPAIMAALGMLCGYCGTLVTPMAANFNIVPAMLLDLKDRNAVIKAQVPIALVVLAANVLLMYLCVYRF
jgi:uncharacterized membrane protein